MSQSANDTKSPLPVGAAIAQAQNWFIVPTGGTFQYYAMDAHYDPLSGTEQDFYSAEALNELHPELAATIDFYIRKKYTSPGAGYSVRAEPLRLMLSYLRGDYLSLPRAAFLPQHRLPDCERCVHVIEKVIRRADDLILCYKHFVPYASDSTEPNACWRVVYAERSLDTSWLRKVNPQGFAALLVCDALDLDTKQAAIELFCNRPDSSYASAVVLPSNLSHYA